MNQNSQDITKAVALFYDGENTPVITAKGSGAVAEEIIEIAQNTEVPLCDNAPLAELLSQMELGDTIPENLYVAIAHIIAFAYELQLKSLPED